jgi:hypothetical protein
MFSKKQKQAPNGKHIAGSSRECADVSEFQIGADYLPAPST